MLSDHDRQQLNGEKQAFRDWWAGDARCTETLDEPVGNVLTDDVRALRDRLLDVQRTRPCAQCWTSCRGFAECMHKPPRWRQFREFLVSVRPRA